MASGSIDRKCNTVRVLVAVSLGCAHLLGCVAGSRPIQEARPATVMVYGHVDLPETVRGRVQAVRVHRLGEAYASPLAAPPRVHFFANGDFFAEGLEPGRYYVDHVVADMERFYLRPADRTESDAELTGRAVEVGAGEIVYLGDHWIRDWKRSQRRRPTPKVAGLRLVGAEPRAASEPVPNFMSDTDRRCPFRTFAMSRTLEPTYEGRVLRNILPALEGSGWDVEVRARLAELR